jgi:hypothetical protein
MAQQFRLYALNGGAIPEITQWVNTLSGTDKENAIRIQGLQEATWLSGNEETPHPEFATLWERYILENNLDQVMVD